MGLVKKKILIKDWNKTKDVCKCSKYKQYNLK